VAESITTDALVLKRVPLGEADVVFTLMTRAHGRLSALARGARGSKRRFGAALELGVLARVELRERRGGELWTLGSATTARRYAIADVVELAHASYGAELVRELTAVEQPEPEVFELLVELYAAIAEVGPRAVVLRRFELALLGALGLAPALGACAACGQPPGEGALLDPSRGLVCRTCAASVRGLGVRPLAEPTRAWIAEVATAASLTCAPLDDGPVALEARAAVAAVLGHHVGKPLRSVEFIGKLSAAAARPA
jgi:DNA repair protein RecO (recombination protein O)